MHTITRGPITVIREDFSDLPAYKDCRALMSLAIRLPIPLTPFIHYLIFDFSFV